jgi:hypothetical protein
VPGTLRCHAIEPPFFTFPKQMFNRPDMRVRYIQATSLPKEASMKLSRLMVIFSGLIAVATVNVSADELARIRACVNSGGSSTPVAFNGKDCRFVQVRYCSEDGYQCVHSRVECPSDLSPIVDTHYNGNTTCEDANSQNAQAAPASAVNAEYCSQFNYQHNTCASSGCHFDYDTQLCGAN